MRVRIGPGSNRLTRIAVLAASWAQARANVSFAIFNRDRKWLDLESEAQLEDTFTIDTPLGKSPTIRRLRYKDVPFYYLPRYGDRGSGEGASAFAASTSKPAPESLTVR